VWMSKRSFSILPQQDRDASAPDFPPIPGRAHAPSPRMSGTRRAPIKFFNNRVCVMRGERFPISFPSTILPPLTNTMSDDVSLMHKPAPTHLSMKQAARRVSFFLPDQ